MPDEQRDDVRTGASAPEPSLVARQARATTPGVDGDLNESPGGADPVAIDRVDARGATLGSSAGEADPGEETATTGGADSAARTADDDPLTRS
jgi:hypothetical protein